MSVNMSMVNGGEAAVEDAEEGAEDEDGKDIPPTLEPSGAAMSATNSDNSGNGEETTGCLPLACGDVMKRRNAAKPCFMVMSRYDSSIIAFRPLLIASSAVAPGGNVQGVSHGAYQKLQYVTRPTLVVYLEAEEHDADMKKENGGDRKRAYIVHEDTSLLRHTSFIHTALHNFRAFVTVSPVSVIPMNCSAYRVATAWRHARSTPPL